MRWAPSSLPVCRFAPVALVGDGSFPDRHASALRQHLDVELTTRERDWVSGIVVELRRRVGTGRNPMRAFSAIRPNDKRGILAIDGHGKISEIVEHSRGDPNAQ